MVDDLDALYAREDIGYEQKLAMREEIFDRAQQIFAEEIQPQLRESTFAAFGRTPLNNATLISRRLYYRRLDLFEEVFQRYRGDLPQTLAALTSVARGAEDPFAAVEAWLSG